MADPIEETGASFSLDKSDVRRAFERAAATYEAHAVLQAQVERRCLERLDLVKLTPAWILDIGCGPGIASRQLSGRYPKGRVVSLDLAHAMTRLARARKRWFAKQSFVCADGDSLPFQPAVFDLVFSNLALQWSAGIDRAFAEARRVLAPRGLFMFTTFGPDTLHELRDAWRRVDDGEHLSVFFDMHDIGDALVRAGFAAPVMDVEHFTLTYDNLRALAADLKAIGAHNASTSRHRALTGKNRWRALVQAYETRRTDGRLPATYEVCYGHAWVPDKAPQRTSGNPNEAPIAWLGKKGARR